MRDWLRSSIGVVAFASVFILFLVARSANATFATFTDTMSTSVRFEAGRWGCVHSQGYWKKHPDAWPVEVIVIGGVSSEKEVAVEILKTQPQGDATYILAHQLLAAMLNIENGALGADVAPAIEQANGWLVKHPLGSDPADEEKGVGIELAGILEAYNNGRGQSESCSGDTPDEDEEPCDDPTSAADVDAQDAEKEGNQEGDKPGDCFEVEETESPEEGESTFPQPGLPDQDRGGEADGPQCVWNVEYWRSHPAIWPTDHLVLGGISYSLEDAIALLNRPSEGDLSLELARQLIAAKLNVVLKDIDQGMEATIASADQWLIEHPAGSNPNNEQRDTGSDLLRDLQRFNETAMSPDLCKGESEASGEDIESESREGSVAVGGEEGSSNPVEPDVEDG